MSPGFPRTLLLHLLSREGLLNPSTRWAPFLRSNQVTLFCEKVFLSQEYESNFPADADQGWKRDYSRRAILCLTLLLSCHQNVKHDYLGWGWGHSPPNPTPNTATELPSECFKRLPGLPKIVTNHWHDCPKICPKFCCPTARCFFIACVKPEFSDLGMVKFSDLPSPGIVSGLLHTETLDTHPDEAPRYPVKEPGTQVPC